MSQESTWQGSGNTAMSIQWYPTTSAGVQIIGIPANQINPQSNNQYLQPLQNASPHAPCGEASPQTQPNPSNVNLAMPPGQPVYVAPPTQQQQAQQPAQPWQLHQLTQVVGHLPIQLQPLLPQQLPQQAPPVSHPSQPHQQPSSPPHQHQQHHQHHQQQHHQHQQQQETPPIPPPTNNNGATVNHRLPQQHLKPQPLSATNWLQKPLANLAQFSSPSYEHGLSSDNEMYGFPMGHTRSTTSGELNWSLLGTDETDSAWSHNTPNVIPSGISGSSSNEGDVSGSTDTNGGGSGALSNIIADITATETTEEPQDINNKFLNDLVNEFPRTPTPTDPRNQVPSLPQRLGSGPVDSTITKRKKKNNKGRKRSPAPNFEHYNAYEAESTDDGGPPDPQIRLNTPSPPPLLAFGAEGCLQRQLPVGSPKSTYSSGVIGSSPRSSITGDVSSSEGSLLELAGITQVKKKKQKLSQRAGQRTPVMVRSYSALDDLLPETLTEGIPNSNTQIQLKRHDLVESPTSKTQFKDFLKKLRDSEKSGASSREGFTAAKVFALKGLEEQDVPQKIHWRICMELADLAKRENLVDEAAYWFHKVNQLQPFASQGWLEHAKMEEECGRLDVCQQLLQTGLRFCPYNESLLVKGIKYEEQMTNHVGARTLLSRLKNVRLEKSWKTILEGALFEARAGNVNISRKIFKYLIANIPRHGPIYYEAYRLEEKCEQFDRAMQIVEQGLTANPRYGPLWFGALRLYERAAVQKQMEQQLQYVPGGNNISGTSNSALYCPYCLLAHGLLPITRNNIKTQQTTKGSSSMTSQPSPTSSCSLPSSYPDNSMRPGSENGSSDNTLLTPFTNSWPSVLQRPNGPQCCHCARWNMIAGDTILVPQLPSQSEAHQVTCIPVNLGKVRDTISRAVQNISRELVWKVYFEKAQIEERASNIADARAGYVMAALNCLPNLRWKVWLGGARTELNHENDEVARQLLDRALMEVPRKTKALVLLECVRLEEYKGNLEKARQILQRAHIETKYEWKVFLESILLEMRAGNTNGAIQASLEALDIHRGTGRLWAVLIQLKHADGEEEQQRVFCEALKEVPKSGEVWCEGARMYMNPLSSRFDLARARQFLEFAIKFTPQYGDSFIEFCRLELLTNGQAVNSQLEQLCVNAEPNYGPMWFHCKLHSLYSTRQVLRTAKIMLQTEMASYQNVYQTAIIKGRNQTTPPSSSVDNVQPYTFATGLPSLNYIYHNVHSLEPFLRRKIIFGSEQIYP